MTAILLLFGAGGQLGQEIVARSAALDIKVIARARSQTDIADARQVAAAMDAAKPGLVINAGAYTKVDQAESEPDEAYRANATGAGIVAEVCASAGVPLVHISTDYVFDGKKSAPYVEDDPPAPLGVYGASKLAGEEAVRQRHKEHIILRTSWVYGRYGANFLKTILRLAGERDELNVVSDQRGSPTNTCDLAEIVLQLMPGLPGSAHWGTYHFSGEGETSWYQFADEILKTWEIASGERPKLNAITTAEYPTAARRPANSVLDNSLFKATFGFKARPWREAVKETVNILMAPGRM
jgi:dTDP-4-dehydrorhamnose reductase